MVGPGLGQGKEGLASVVAAVGPGVMDAPDNLPGVVVVVCVITTT